jgi:hypothetical protein
MYALNDFIDYQNLPELCRTWKHSAHLSDRDDVEYAYLYSPDGEVESVCPIFISDSWKDTSGKISAIMKSVITAQCNLKDHCIYDFIPPSILERFLKDKENVIRHVFENLERPEHYEILKKAHILTEEMNANGNLYDGQIKNTNYNIFGTRTGRLSNKKSAIPILTMKKEDRTSLEPSNDLFVELDFNAAELRTLLALSGKKQPANDIHDWNMQQADGNITREEMKKRTFAWLYNPEARDPLLERLYSRDLVKDTYRYKDGVKTPFLRYIETDERRALNYIVQSTSSDVCIEQAYELRDFFKDCRTKVCYLLHDSVILDFAKEDIDKFLEAKRIFGDTRFGKYVVNSSIGKNFGEMKEI